MGPDADDPELTLDAFRQRIRRHPGELKPLLRNPRFVAGIGNAYSDEILWEAQLAPFRKRSTLTDADVDAPLHRDALRLADAIDRLRVLVPPDIQTQLREFLKVHCAAASRVPDAVESCARSGPARRRRSAGPASRPSMGASGDDEHLADDDLVGVVDPVGRLERRHRGPEALRDRSERVALGHGVGRLRGHDRRRGRGRKPASPGWASGSESATASAS